ncbi:MAG TPA: hypothetical protein VFN23_04180 [Ktedonobacteraceae bacterium]|nr:hypothetical protein [Ktedonobacteraceae bacterium]
MSQQDLEMNVPRENLEHTTYGNYGSVPPQQPSQQPYSIGVGMYSPPAGQKLTAGDWHPSSSQRLALGIVSIIAFFGVFLVSLAAAAGMGSQGHAFGDLILLLGLFFSFVVVIVINALYNRRP